MYVHEGIFVFVCVCADVFACISARNFVCGVCVCVDIFVCGYICVCVFLPSPLNSPSQPLSLHALLASYLQQTKMIFVVKEE